VPQAKALEEKDSVVAAAKKDAGGDALERQSHLSSSNPERKDSTLGLTDGSTIVAPANHQQSLDTSADEDESNYSSDADHADNDKNADETSLLRAGGTQGAEDAGDAQGAISSSDVDYASDQDDWCSDSENENLPDEQLSERGSFVPVRTASLREVKTTSALINNLQEESATTELQTSTASETLFAPAIGVQENENAVAESQTQEAFAHALASVTTESQTQEERLSHGLTSITTELQTSVAESQTQEGFAHALASVTTESQTSIGSETLFAPTIGVQENETAVAEAQTQEGFALSSTSDTPQDTKGAEDIGVNQSLHISRKSFVPPYIPDGTSDVDYSAEEFLFSTLNSENSPLLPKQTDSFAEVN
jgi:hypothetical protein